MTGWWQRWMNGRQLRRATAVGRDVIVEGAVHVHNLGEINIADAVRLTGCSAMSHLHTGPGGRLDVGAGVVIGHGAAIAAHDAIAIGPGATLGPFVMLLDTDFHEAGRHDAAGQTGAITIGARARLGARVTVLRGSTIGIGAVIAAGSVVKGNIPAGAHVAGNPARPVSSSGRGDREVTLDAIIDVMVATFGLSQRPQPETERQALPAWDSLGALNLLLSLEQTFDVSVSSEEMARVARVSDLLRLLEGGSR